MFIATCPEPECGAPAEVTPWAVAGSTSGPVAHVRTLCANKHRFHLPAAWIRSYDAPPATHRDQVSPGRPGRR